MVKGGIVRQGVGTFWVQGVLSMVGSMQPMSELMRVRPPPQEGHRGLPHVTTPRNAHQPYPYDEGEVSPVDAGDFATAMGSVGLSFEPSFEPPHQPPGPSRPTPGRRRSTLNAINETVDASHAPFSMTPTPMMNEPDLDNYFSPQESDSTPLTDVRYLAPISGAPPPAPQSSSHSRMGSRLGDDLNMEAGRSARPSSTLSSRSLAPPLSGSTLSRAGTMIRNASQRIVNLSNEPDAVDSHIPSPTISFRQRRKNGSTTCLTCNARLRPRRYIQSLFAS